MDSGNWHGDMSEEFNVAASVQAIPSTSSCLPLTVRDGRRQATKDMGSKCQE